MRSTAIGILVFLVGCESSSTCVDRDRDELGVGCSSGPDCDDENAARGQDCDRVPAPDCDATPTATGCPCVFGATTPCYSGPAGTEVNAMCHAGTAVCVNGHFGLCRGEVLPDTEFCDGIDQDCDGSVDEGVRSPCGGCDAGCAGDVLGDPFTAAPPGFFLSGLGELVLPPAPRGRRSTVWAINTAEGTVSRIDASTARETARYATGDRIRIPLEPSRAAVDWQNDVWVANRAFTAIPTVTRIAGERSRCVDRNGDGAIQTSSGPTDVRAFGEDECMLGHFEVGAIGEVARALAIDGNVGLVESSPGNAWVGLYAGQAFVEVDGNSGEVLRRIETPGFAPYSAAFDPWGTLWAISREGLLLQLDPTSGRTELREVPLDCYWLYGLAIDARGRVAMTGFACDRVSVYDPSLDRWSTMSTEKSVRGAAFVGEQLWVAHTAGRLTRLSLDPLRVDRSFSLAGLDASPLESIGVSGDDEGSVWVVSAHDGPGGPGLVTRVSEAEGDVTAQVRVGTSPHTQGDLTGTQLFPFTPGPASLEHVFDGCAQVQTEWLRVHIDGHAGSHGSIRIEARHGADASALGAWVSLGALPEDGSVFPLSFPVGGVIEVRATMALSGRSGSPRLRSIGVEWSCGSLD